MSKKKNKKKLTKQNEDDILICTKCNPKKFLKFNFSFTREISIPAHKDVKGLLEKIKFLSGEEYLKMVFKYRGNKQNFIEKIPLNIIKKDIPQGFRETYPPETNEKYDVFRIYSAGTPNGTANPRVIGMIKNTIFYIFYIDWEGKLYPHN